VQMYGYFVSQSSEFCCHNPLCCFSTSVIVVVVWKLLDTLLHAALEEAINTSIFFTIHHL